MCGICGFVGFNDNELLRRMTEILVHRGPDDNGFYEGEDVGLGHRRLSVIDLISGRQPIYNEDRSICIVCNGEIYNYRELRKELEERGHRFYTHSDTEVAVHSYEEWRFDCVSRFNGMFAFALWDKNQRVLFLSRDRLGIRPLYYTSFDKKLLFASEIKSILECKDSSREINLESLDKYLSLRYVPGYNTIFKKIFKLPPGHVLIYQNGNVSLYSYWNIKMLEAEGQHKSYIEEFRDLLKSSINMQLMSDVPLGAYLSGGLDSTSVVALMSKLGKVPVKTFSVGFDSETDELKKARRISEHFQTDHHEIIITQQDFEKIPKIVWHMDDLFGDPIIVPYFSLSKLASQHVKVVLTGDGADEILAGYIHHLVLCYSHIYRKIFSNNLVSRIAGMLFSLMPTSFLDLFFPYPSSLGQKGKERLLEFIKAGMSYDGDILSPFSVFSQEEKKRLYSSDLYNTIKKITNPPAVSRENSRDFKGHIPLNSIILNDLTNWLPDYILFLNDRAAMANSIESRLPFLDHRIVEFVCSIPQEFKLRRLTNKYLLRRAMEDMIPAATVRERKQAFFVPIEKYFYGKFEDLVYSVLSKENIKKRGYFNYSYILQTLKDFKRSPLLIGKQIMSLVILEIWHREFLD